MVDISLIKTDAKYYIENDKLIFKKLENNDINDNLDKVKNKLKKYYKLYTTLINIVSPVYTSKGLNKFIEEHVDDATIALNIGSGNSKISTLVCNIDIFAYDNVDVVCDIANLPFQDGSIDVIINIAVLEHVENPQGVVDEIFRVLKPGGLVYTAFPFIQGFHASPYDFTRVTEEGIKVLHKKFEQIEVKPFGGPTSGMLWVFQEWIAILLSFGNKKLHILIYLLVMVLTFPIKFLDYFLIKHPLAKNISSGFTYIGRKR